MAAALEITWSSPKVCTYSLLRLVAPGVCWTEPRSNPDITAYRVELLETRENSWRTLADTVDTYVAVPSDDYSLNSAYKFRVATINAYGAKSAWAESATFVASPLRFDFSAQDVVKLPDGRSVNNQRFLFYLF